jgi:hypothetical protein
VALLTADNKQQPFKMASWGFGSLWGGNAAKKKDSTKNAILGLRSTLEMLSKREKHLQNQMDEQDAIARKHVSSNKSRKYCCPVCGGCGLVGMVRLVEEGRAILQEDTN